MSTDGIKILIVRGFTDHGVVVAANHWLAREDSRAVSCFADDLGLPPVPAGLSLFEGRMLMRGSACPEEDPSPEYEGSVRPLTRWERLRWAMGWAPFPPHPEDLAHGQEDVLPREMLERETLP